MADLQRPPVERPLAVTRAHLLALGALSLSLAVLSFFVGLQVGRNESPPVAAPPVAPLVSDQARSGDLEVLLANIDQAKSAATPLTFPAELPKTTPPPAAPPADGSAAAASDAPAAAPPVADVPGEEHAGSASVAAGAAVAPAVAEEVPKGGWAVQVATRADEHDAAVLVETLRAAGLPAYHVVALVQGKAAWRVRVGGYGTKEAATAALSAVASKAGADDATVTPAP
jgi:cell division protein FtsN